MKNTLTANLKGDILGGITAGIIALPLAIAFGVSSGLGAAAGLYGAIIVGLVASLFGGTPTQISGPTGPLTVLVTSILAVNSDSPEIIFAAVFLSGIFQIIFGIFKIGKLVNFIPYPVISGFMSGIGTIIILLQLNAILGIEFSGTPVEGFINAVRSISDVNLQAFLLAVVTLLIVFLTPKKVAKILPPALLALVVGTIISVVFNFNVGTIGEIPSGFPAFNFPEFHFSEFEIVISSALTIAVLGSIDTLLTSLVADSMTKTKHKSDKELIGQGIANMVASLFGGLVSCGATMRTAVNIKSGGRTKLSGIVHSVFLMLIVVFFAPIASKIPLAVLAGILIKVGISIIDYKFIKLIKFAPRNDLLVMLLVFFITIFDDLILAVGVGVVMSSILFAANVAKQTDVKLKELGESENYINEDLINNTMIMHIDGTLFFGSASLIASRVEEVWDNNAVIIDCSDIKTIDISGVFALEDLILTLKDRGVQVVVIFNSREVAAIALKLGLRKIISSNSFVFSKEDALGKLAKE